MALDLTKLKVGNSGVSQKAVTNVLNMSVPKSGKSLTLPKSNTLPGTTKVVPFTGGASGGWTPKLDISKIKVEQKPVPLSDINKLYKSGAISPGAKASKKSGGSSSNSSDTVLKAGQFGKAEQSRTPTATTTQPTVISSGSKVEAIPKMVQRLNSLTGNLAAIPKMVQRLNSLTGNLAASTTGVGGNPGGATFGSSGLGAGSIGDNTLAGVDYDPEDLFNISEDPKKKKKKQLGGMSLPKEPKDPYMEMLDKMQRSVDNQFNSKIDAVRSQYDQYEQDQVKANESGLNQIKNALNLGGSSRYAPISSSGIVQSQQAAGIRAIATLNQQENQVIAEAQAAKDANDYQLMEQKMNVIEKLRAEKLAVAGSVQDGIQGNINRASRDNQIAELVAQGVTSPMQLLRSLNYDEQGNQIGDYTIAEIGAAMKGLGDLSGPAGVFEFDKGKIGGLLASGIDAPTIKAIQADLNSGADIEDVLGAGSGFTTEQATAVRKALGADAMNMMTNMTPGKGAKTPAEEFAIRTRLFGPVAAILNRGVISDADRVYLNDVIGFARGQGFSEQQLLDEISGWGVDVNTPFNNGFRDVLLVNRDEGENITNDLAQLGGMLKRGNYKMAMDKVENIALAKVKDEPGYVGKIEAEMYTKWIDSLKQTAVNSGVGLVSGNFQNVLGKLKSADATKLKSELNQLYDKLDPKTAGEMIADITDKKSNFFAKLDVYQDRVLADHNATRSTVGLPEVRVKDLLDPNERLNLYVDKNASTDGLNSLGI